MKSGLLTLVLSIIFIVACSEKKEIQIETGTMHDQRDGIVYKTVKIDDTWWMTENLSFVTDSGSWCYDDDSTSCDSLGRLYDWETAQLVVPEGWSMPSVEDYDKLVQMAGGTNEEAYKILMPGGKLGFNVVKAGARFDERLFKNMGESGFYWTSTPDSANTAWCVTFEDDLMVPSKGNYNKPLGFSVRCIKKDIK